MRRSSGSGRPARCCHPRAIVAGAAAADGDDATICESTGSCPGAPAPLAARPRERGDASAAAGAALVDRPERVRRAGRLRGASRRGARWRSRSRAHAAPPRISRGHARATTRPRRRPPPSRCSASAAALTPSGDDFVGTALFARRPAVRCRRADAEGWRRTVDTVLAAAPARTHPLSVALLGDLAPGSGVRAAARADARPGAATHPMRARAAPPAGPPRTLLGLGHARRTRRRHSRSEGVRARGANPRFPARRIRGTVIRRSILLWRSCGSLPTATHCRSDPLRPAARARSDHAHASRATRPSPSRSPSRPRDLLQRRRAGDRRGGRGRARAVTSSAATATLDETTERGRIGWPAAGRRARGDCVWPSRAP